MDISITKIRSILSELIAGLDKANEQEMVDHLLSAYKAGTSEKELAYNFGLWKRMLFDKNPRLGQSLSKELKFLRDYFEELEVVEYFDLHKEFKPKYSRNYLLILLLGLILILAGVFREEAKLHIVSITLKTVQPIVNNTLTFVIAGFMVIIAGLLRLKHHLDKKKFYGRFGK
jgi:hypothetical protein